MSYVESLVAFMQQYKCSSIVDASAGDGSRVKELREAGFSVERAEGAALEGLAENAFDFVLCRGATLAKTGDVVATLTRLTRVLRPQGVCYVDRVPDVATEEELHQQMHDAGLECMKKTPFVGETTYDVIIATKADHDNIQGGSENLYTQMQDIYRKVWDPKGRMCWSYFASPSMTFHEGGQYHVERMAEKGGFTKDSKVLDIGCGNGNSILWIADKYGCEIVGCDPTECLIETATQAAAEKFPHVKATFLAKTLQDCQFETGEFTHIWSNNAIGYVPVEYRAEFWADVARVLKPGGTLVFDDILMPCATFENGVLAGHEKLSQEAAENFFKRLHFETPLHSVDTYDKYLPTLGLEKMESEDLAIHQRQTYVIVRERANALGYYMLAKQYNASVRANEQGYCGWGRFIYKKPAA